MQILYLSIAGFIIKLVFHRSSDKQNKVTPEGFCKEILLHNEGFVFNFEPSSTDFIIEFLEAKGFDIYESPKKKGFIHFYSPVAYNHISSFYHISRVQFVYLIKSAVEKLLSQNGFVMHCSASLVGKSATIYIGQSGIGKTTLVSMLEKKFSILADDEGYIRKEDNTFYFYQGPFLERSYNFSKTYRRFAISSIFILEQGNTCRITKPTNEDIRQVSLQLISSQNQSADKKRLVSELKKDIPFQKIIFTKRKKELMDCILNHSPFNNTPCFNPE